MTRLGLGTQIELVEIDDTRRTSLGQYLAHLANGQYPTPRTGEWRAHDEAFHFSRVSSLSEEGAELVMASAHIALNMLEGDASSRAPHRIAEELDYFLAVVPGSWESSEAALLQFQERYGAQQRLF